MGFCECTTKFLLFVFNLACAILGLVIIALGVLTNVHGSSFKSLLQSELTTTSILFIVVGCIVFIIAFFGCCGVARESSCMITTYAVILSAILLVQLALGIMAFVYRNKVDAEVRKSVENLFNDYPDKQNEIDKIQKELQCCGAHGPSFWKTLPASCCKNGEASCHTDDAFHDGCYDKVLNFIKSQLRNIGIAALVIAGVEFFCIASAFCMSASIRRRERMMI